MADNKDIKGQVGEIAPETEKTSSASEPKKTGGSTANAPMPKTDRQTIDEINAAKMQSAEEMYAAQNAANQAQMDAVTKANRDAATYFADVVAQQRREDEERRALEERQSNIDANAAKYAGVTEFASALTNLIGTSLGSTHQQHHQFSQDWMKTADAERRARINRNASIRDRQRQQEQKLREMQQKNAVQEATLEAGMKTEKARQKAALRASELSDAEEAFYLKNGKKAPSGNSSYMNRFK